MKDCISILLTTYNRLELLKVCVKSIQQQDYPNLELIIVNDCSTDGTFDFLKNLSINNNINLFVIHNKINLGLQTSLNIGLHQAKGKFIARIDDDDEWVDEKKLSKQVAFLEQNLDVVLLGTGYISNGINTVNPITDIEIRNQILFRCPFRHSTVLIRKSALVDVGVYDESLPYSEDWELWLRLGKNNKLGNLKDITTKINTEFNASSKYFLQQLSLNQNILNNYWSFYPNRSSAKAYHFGLKVFFKIIPLESKLHLFAKNIFSYIFINK